MFDYTITLGSPWYLLILAVLPPMWWYGYRRLAVLGPIRRWIALGLRTLLVALLVVAIADIKTVRISDRLTVYYLLDQSLSIPESQRRAMIEDYVIEEVKRHRRDKDRAGVIVFGRDAAIEIPAYDDEVRMSSEIETLLERDFTSLAAAMKLAQGAFPEDSAKRIVLISDGNENLGKVRGLAKSLAAAGIGIDVVPIRYSARAEVVVEQLVVPGNVRRGEPFHLKAVVSNTAEASAGKAAAIPGRLILSQLVDGQRAELYEEHITLPPGKKKVYPIPQQIDASNFYTYEVRFIPDRPEDDAMPQNNRATAFTHVRGEGKILLIENCIKRGEFNTLVERLRRQGLEVTVMTNDQLFTTLGELQPFDTVVLANVPRVTDLAEDTSGAIGFSESQIRMLVQNTQQLGAGLVMIGGGNSFGAGGWTGTALEEAMPVDFQIKNAKVAPRGALVLIMHASEMAQGNYWQKVIAHEAVKALGGQDYCGLLHWTGNRDLWMWGGGLLTVSNNRRAMMAKINQMTPGDMPEFEPAMRKALIGFQKVPGAAIKHMVIISDGDPGKPTPGPQGALAGLINLNVTVSAVTVGGHGPAGSQTMRDIAKKTGGKYYAVVNARALPRIFQREARRVARPLIYDKPVNPEVLPGNKMVLGLDSSLPTIHGFVQTTLKENPMVEVSLRRPAGDPRFNTILASWTYGLGKSVAFTSDAGANWTTEWTGLDLYDRLFTQMIRYSMRPTGGSANLTVSTDIEDGQVRVIATALGEEDEFLNLHTVIGRAVGPDLKSVPFELKQTAPGRYIGVFPAEDAGSYHLLVSSINPKGEIVAAMQTGVNRPYSDEFRSRVGNEPLLSELAGLIPEGGKPGLLIVNEKGDLSYESLAKYDTFREDELAKATSSQAAWHYFVLMGSCLLFFDVLIRRVQVSLMWVPPLAGRLRDKVLRREPQPVQPEYIGRLKSRKAEVGGRIDQLRAEARFEAPEDASADVAALDEAAAPMDRGTKTAKPAAPSISGEENREEESYTERLLRAKKKVVDDREKKP